MAGKNLMNNEALNKTIENPQRLQLSLEDAYGLANDNLIGGNYSEARSICTQVLTQVPDNADFSNLLATLDHIEHVEAAKIRFTGANYLEWLEWFHNALKPSTYLEIGVESGQSMQFAKAPTLAIGIDPEINIVHPQYAWTKLFKETSDYFFDKRDVLSELNGQYIDLAFIDGLHTYDQALKDFINIEKYSHQKSVILFHDIFPITPITAERDRKTIFWLGDTWKAVMILIEHRPDLRIFTIPAYPSGLTVVLNANSKSTTLIDSFDDINQKWASKTLEEFLPNLEGHLNVVDNSFDDVIKIIR